MKTIFSFAFIALATVQGSQAGSSLTVVNQTPIVKNGATIYDPVAQANISVFGASCPAGGCLINGGSSKTFENIAPEDPTNYLFGIQWNIARRAPADGLCDNACRQLRIDLNECKFVSYEESGTCYVNSHGVKDYSPRWWPVVNMGFSAGKCVLTVTEDSHMEQVDGSEPDVCSCDYGAYPCHCGKNPDSKCSGQCPGNDIDSDERCSGSNQNTCCFCKAGKNTCN